MAKTKSLKKSAPTRKPSKPAATKRPARATKQTAKPKPKKTSPTPQAMQRGGFALTNPAELEERQRIGHALQRYLPVLPHAKAIKTNEAETAKIVAKFFQDVLGWDAQEVTSEYKVTSTYTDEARDVNGKIELVKSNYRDLAVRSGDKILLMIEVRAIGLPLRDKDVRSTSHFASRERVPYVLLTNGEMFRLYRPALSKTSQDELIFEVNLGDGLSSEELTQLYLISKQSLPTNQVAEYGKSSGALSHSDLVEAIKSKNVMTALLSYFRSKKNGKVDSAMIKETAESLRSK